MAIRWRRALLVVALVAVSGVVAASGWAALGARASGRSRPRTGLVLAHASHVVGWVYTLHDGAACEVGDALAVVKSRAGSTLRLEHAALADSLTVRSNTEWSVVALPIGSDGEVAAGFHLFALSRGRELGGLHGLSLAPSHRSRHWYAIVARLKLSRPMHSTWRIAGVDIRYRLQGRTREAFLPQDVRVAAANRCRH
jgi:hypothetical protein